MPRQRLTDAAVRGLKHPTSGHQIDVFDDLVTGLCVRVGTKSKTYQVLYRVSGKLTREKIGNVKDMTLADARKHAKSSIEKAARGVSTAADKKTAAANTLEATYKQGSSRCPRLINI